MEREEFKKGMNEAEQLDPPDEEPWLPFRSREDFEFAEIVHDAAMNQPQIDTLIKFVHRCQEDPGKFTLRSSQDLRKSWEDASALLTGVSVLYIHFPRTHPTAFLVQTPRDQA